MDNIEFYDVSKRQKVSVPASQVKKRTYTRTTKNGSTQTRYAVVAEMDGRKLTKFVNEQMYNSLDVPVVSE
jgi:hypothetical protein